MWEGRAIKVKVKTTKRPRDRHVTEKFKEEEQGAFRRKSSHLSSERFGNVAKVICGIHPSFAPERYDAFHKESRRRNLAATK